MTVRYFDNVGSVERLDFSATKAYPERCIQVRFVSHIPQFIVSYIAAQSLLYLIGYQMGDAMNLLFHSL